MEQPSNLIALPGYCSPFVYCDTDGIHVGDSDNHHVFPTVAAAREHCAAARLSDERLKLSAPAFWSDPHGNLAAEYYWHFDAGLQLAALDKLEGKDAA